MKKVILVICLFASLCFSCSKEETVKPFGEPLFHYYLELDFLKNGKSIINNSTELFADHKNLTTPHTMTVESNWGEVFQEKITGVADKDNFRLVISGYINRGSFNNVSEGKVLLTIKLNIPALNKNRTEIITMELKSPRSYLPCTLYNVNINGMPIQNQEEDLYTIDLD